jgi:threonylcarbamoyladenosine tRNA methylthiotransferase MtaB
LDETALAQLRFSSIEPQDITEDFVALVASSERLARHFHVPLQSGSDRVLRAMHRWYRAGHYAERAQLIRRLLPDAAIGADVIVGFPGETREDFEATAAFLAQQPLIYLHVFSFSARPETAAAAWGDPVAPKIIRERARALRALGSQKSAAFRDALAGRTVRALTLRSGGDGWTDALTGNYLKLRLAGRHPANQWHELRLTAGAEDLVAARPI